MILIDTSGIIAALAPTQRLHEEAAAALRAATPPLIVSPFVLAEIDYLLTKYASVHAAMQFHDEIARGAYELANLDHNIVRDARDVMMRYARLEIGIADASIVVYSKLYRTVDVLTLDERHFRTLRSDGKKKFRILPSDL